MLEFKSLKKRKYRCDMCKNEWIPRTKIPKFCPGCKRMFSFGVSSRSFEDITDEVR